MKLIHINPKSRFSPQYHNKRSEFWKVIKGTPMIELDSKMIKLAEGETITIPRQSKHSIGTLDSSCTILEIAYGKFDENEIVRIEADYGRTAITAKTQVVATS